MCVLGVGGEIALQRRPNGLQRKGGGQGIEEEMFECLREVLKLSCILNFQISRGSGAILVSPPFLPRQSVDFFQMPIKFHSMFIKYIQLPIPKHLVYVMGLNAKRVEKGFETPETCL